MDTHHYFMLSINAAPLKGEMSVLFSGKGKPVGGHFIGPAVHDYYLIHIVLDGEGVFETLGETHACRAGDAFVIFPDILVKYEASMSNPWTYMWVAFSGDIVESSLTSIGITPDRAVVRACPLPSMQRMFRSLRKSMEGTDFPALGNMEASGWLRLILYELGRLHLREETVVSGPRSRSYRQIDQAIRLLSLQYGQQLSIEGIAQTLGYHRAHLTRLFKEATGLSPMQYLFKVRMKKAEELLEGELTIAQIAASVGYNDPLFFTKQFHKWSGQSPTEFRRDLIHK
ncbi:AraC family transcriptional regulator [Paenibacillus alkaliterrae]|uniref:AraC family transcriptional regulator n=1 Tax=Paenibacillus alkaliterrae TaxID=320909 RepID=UPI001F3E329A|nr:AraC family transcriptional regulator [Paenibacillus alkaliterrae]MCF2940964.1 AraC family transcriptional regulator [Paenibacillus alkaliterrae]